MPNDDNIPVCVIQPWKCLRSAAQCSYYLCCWLSLSLATPYNHRSHNYTYRVCNWADVKTKGFCRLEHLAEQLFCTASTSAPFEWVFYFSDWRYLYASSQDKVWHGAAKIQQTSCQKLLLAITRLLLSTLTLTLGVLESRALTLNENKIWVAVLFYVYVYCCGFKLSYFNAVVTQKVCSWSRSSKSGLGLGLTNLVWFTSLCIFYEASKHRQSPKREVRNRQFFLSRSLRHFHGISHNFLSNSLTFLGFLGFQTLLLHRMVNGKERE